jgi:hypothetical protein
MRKLNMIEIEEILYRWRQGLKVKEITRSLGYARNTVRSVIKQAKVLQEELGKGEDITKELLVKRYGPVVSLAPQKLDQLTIHEGKIKNWLAERAPQAREEVHKC